MLDNLLVALLALACVTWNVWVYVTSPLRKYPGPFLAGTCSVQTNVCLVRLMLCV